MLAGALIPRSVRATACTPSHLLWQTTVNYLRYQLPTPQLAKTPGL